MADFNSFVLPNVRLSYPHIFKRSNFKGNVGKYRAVFMIPKSDKETISMIKKHINDLEEFVDLKVNKDRWCVRDGDNFDNNPEYKDHIIFSASSDHKPVTLDGDGEDITEMQDILYPGCWVKAVVGLWCQNNQYGKRINGNLYGVQFVKDDERFSSIDEDAIREQMTGKSASSQDDSLL